MSRWLLCLCWTLGMPLAVLGAEPSDFQFVSTIAVPSNGTGAFAVELPPKAAAVIHSEADLRLYDAKNQLVPFAYFVARKEQIRTKETLEIFNQGVLSEQYQSFEFRLPDKSEAANRLTLQIADENFERIVSIFAKSEEEDAFRRIADGLRIVRITSKEDGIRYSHLTLPFPPQERKLFQIRIELSGDAAPLTVQGVQVIQLYEMESRRQVIDLQMSELSDEQLQQIQRSPYFQGANVGNHSLYLLTNSFGALPLDRFTVETSADSFTRRAQLLGVHSGDQLLPLARFATTSLFRYGSDRQLNIEQQQMPASAHYLLDVMHGDDSPFAITGVKGSFLSSELRFLIDAQQNEFELPIRILFGRDGGRAPTFDIKEEFRRKKITEFKNIAFGTPARNPAYQPAAATRLSSAEPYLLYAAVGLLVVVLTLYLIRLARFTPPPQGE